MSMNNQEECSSSELKLFKRPVVPSDILNGKFEKIYPITGPIEFLIENVIDYFLDLRQSCLNLKFKMVNSGGLNSAVNEKAGSVNYPIASLFQPVDVLLNGNLISSSANTYAYIAICSFS